MKITELEVLLLLPSKTNPRKFFDSKKIDDMTTSIKQKGILQPLLVRLLAKTANSYEIVAGECRYRAALKAELKTVPCIVRDLTDQEVVEFQVVENVQRGDLTPMEEAGGYRMLHEKFGYSWDDLAAKIGKSKSYIHGRLSLLQVSPKVQAALAEGLIPVSWAEEFRRVVSHGQQDQLLKDAMDDSYGSPENLEEFRAFIDKNYALDLGRAAFSRQDAELVPKAGACTNCPKRTQAQAELFDGVKKDICLDGQCFQSKVRAHGAQLAEAAKEKGQKVITDKNAYKNYDRNYDYKKLEDHVDNYGKVTARQVLKSTGNETLIVVALDDKGHPHEFVKRKDVERLYGTYARQHAKKKTPQQKAADAREGKKKEAEKRKRVIADLAKQRVAREIASTIGAKLGKKWIDPRAAAIIFFDINDSMDADQFEEVVNCAGKPELVKSSYNVQQKELGAYLQKPDKNLPAMLIHFLVLRMFQGYRRDNVYENLLLKPFKIDLKKLQARFEKEVKKEMADQKTIAMVREGEGRTNNTGAEEEEQDVEDDGGDE